MTPTSDYVLEPMVGGTIRQSDGGEVRPDVLDQRMADSEIKSQAFHVAQLRSEYARITALFGVFASLFVLVVIRAIPSLIKGNRGEAWPFALLLAVMTAYEAGWMRLIRSAVTSGREVSKASWAANILIESLLPTTALLLQVHTSFVGPYRVLTSPAVLGYFLFIILSTLHLNPKLSRLAGYLSAAGYVAVSIYIFFVFPNVAAGEPLLAYGTAFAYAALILLGGFAAAAVASQIRIHVVAALHEAENRAKVAQFEHDLGMARSIQQGLLPKDPPVIRGFEVAGWNQPADQTGGDYFDWQQLGDGRVAITVADVTGHGIGAALVMSACRAYARAGFAAAADLQKFLDRLNRLFHEDLPPEKFVTLVSGLLDPERSIMHLISAGHGPLIFYSCAEDGFASVDAQGPPLGLLPHFSYGGPSTLLFDRGDLLVLVTDGFIEWANASDEEFGLDRLREVIRAQRDQPAAKIISEMHSAIVKFTGSMPQNDDLTALIVKRI